MKKLLNNDIVNLVQSIKKYYNLNTIHKTNSKLDLLLKENKPKHIVFLCIDGLGYSLLNNANYLNSNLFEKIDSVFPPTTCCATISLQTGLYPCEHGWIGWSQYIKQYDDVIELFSETGFYSKIKYDLSIIEELKFKKFYEEINNSEEFFPDFVENGSKSLEEMLEKITLHINSNDTTFSYGYWTEPDHVLHNTGTTSKESLQEIKEIDNLIKDFSLSLKDTMIIITADHGHVDTEKINLHDYPLLLDCLKHLPSIESRCVNFFIEEDMHNQFLSEIKPILNYFDLYTKEEFLNSDFFNNGIKNKILDDFLGDYIVIAKDKYMLVYKETDLKTMHGGGLKEEYEVPLIVINN